MTAPIDFAQQNPARVQPLVRSSAGEPARVLRDRFQRDGYLHFPGHVGADKCDALLGEIVLALAPHVRHAAGAAAPVLAGEPFYETDAVWNALYPGLQSLYGLHRFFHEEDLTGLMRLVLDAEPFVYPMKMGRVATPRRLGFETPPHQDAHSHQGGPTMAGIWVALHDVREGMGRLALLPGSHRRGVRRVFPARGVGGVQCEIFPDETTWHVSDVARGDVIVFHSCCVHRAEPNTTRDAVRISVDTRFCDYGAPVFVSNLEPHHGCRIPGLDWPFIYRDWTDTALQYYWADYPNLTTQLQHTA